MKDYKRLTTRNEKGEWTIELNEGLKQAQRDMSADDFISLLFDLIAQRLCDLEDKIENGALVELPCKVGDTVWTINCWQEYGKKELGEPYIVTRYELHENKCSCIEINEKNCYRGGISIIAREKYKGITPYVFLTKAEAEAKLKELKGEIE